MSLSADPTRAVWRVAWRSVDGTVTYSNEFTEKDHAEAYFDYAREQVPNPSQKEVWLECQAVTPWTRVKG